MSQLLDVNVINGYPEEPRMVNACHPGPITAGPHALVLMLQAGLPCASAASHGTLGVTEVSSLREGCLEVLIMALGWRVFICHKKARVRLLVVVAALPCLVLVEDLGETSD
jgi:hypothetical protein